MFGKARIRKWITKGKKTGSIRKETDNNPGYGVSVGQLQADQPVLVPQLSGKITSACIWSSQAIVTHFNELTYMKLTRSKIQ